MSRWRTPAFETLEQPLSRVLGDSTATPFKALGVETLGDLLRLLPRHLMSGTEMTDLASLISEHVATDDYVALLATVSHLAVRGQAPRQRLEADLTDGSAHLRATFFGKPQLIAYWQAVLSKSDRGIFAGKIGWFNGQPQLSHPAFAMITDDGLVGSARNVSMAARVTKDSLIGLYPQTAKLPTWKIAECVELAWEAARPLDDPLPEWIRRQAGVVDLADAIQAVHWPTSTAEHEAGRDRLLFDEAFAAQAAMAYRRADTARHQATPRPTRATGIRAAFDERLPFTLTAQQRLVGDEIAADLDRAQPMSRLLQGEVGSGKTVVALRAMLTVVDAGGQAVLLAPTEVLAQQHAATVTRLLGDLGHGPLLGAENATGVAVVTGSLNAAARKEALARIASGEAGIIIGTHALLATDIRFADLGLVVIDEQHRFGVEQRHALAANASHPHVLVMTATPIPRSVAMTIFGDLDISTLTDVPAGRADVATTVVDAITHPTWVERAWQRIREDVAQGHQAYVVAPRIGATTAKDADKATAASVDRLFEELSAGPLAGLRLARLHGRETAPVKADTMAHFAAGEIDVLVATSMVEVGLDVTNASMMVICDAERFGVSQLHQLRGRIGRGSVPGVCLLITEAPEGTPARQRLETIAATRDGFALAAADLAQRREGDVLGLSQSGGRSSLKLLRVIDHADLIAEARRIAIEAVDRDPDLTDPGVADYVHQIEDLAAADFDEAT
ncbi:MAG: ATP-dependent DNA helicase RecG [Propionibacteriaceae bacterium]|jgi:ATP-dependent DNA helicase RecG|nr:ATP-dependent DNA helicase RecG [Propionibacteriaceae bacterium]